MQADYKPLRLIAFDKEDLKIVSALLQDSIIIRKNMTFLIKEKRFVLIGDRYRWEDEGKLERVRFGLHFETVLNVKFRNFDLNIDNLKLELLAINCLQHQEGIFFMFLEFAGGASIKLGAECIDCQLLDLSEPWFAGDQPLHSIDE